MKEVEVLVLNENTDDETYLLKTIKQPSQLNQSYLVNVVSPNLAAVLDKITAKCFCLMHLLQLAIQEFMLLLKYF